MPPPVIQRMRFRAIAGSKAALSIIRTLHSLYLVCQEQGPTKIHIYTFIFNMLNIFTGKYIKIPAPSTAKQIPT